MSENKQIFFQTIYLTTTDPTTGQETEHAFVGKAMFTPEQIEQLKDKDIYEVITNFEIELPYNPYDDEGNTKAQQKALKWLRNSLKEDSDG